ncbi:hypothetical protein [Effusibacillus pohliae]|uniref:hypothetical protein n=1 Tax=Effusibacillus pohliae TaxID=232270 RepID=UPI0003774EF7|nr:hypothetical protein [Effusibacillus pohliae]
MWLCHAKGGCAIGNDDILKTLSNVIAHAIAETLGLSLPPNVKFADLFTKLQRQAREAKKGIWSLGIYKDEVKNTNDVFLDGKAPKK